jgi:hypothetical protein
VQQLGGQRVVQTIHSGIIVFDPSGVDLFRPGFDNSLSGAKGRLQPYELALYIPDQDSGVRRYPAADGIVGVVVTAALASWSALFGSPRDQLRRSDANPSRMAHRLPIIRPMASMTPAYFYYRGREFLGVLRSASLPLSAAALCHTGTAFADPHTR